MKPAGRGFIGSFVAGVTGRGKGDPREWFSEEEIAKSRKYQRQSRALSFLGSLIAGAEAVVLLRLRMVQDLLAHWNVRNWVLQGVIALATLVIIDVVLSFGLTAYRSLVFEHKWGLGTQRLKGLLADQLRALALSPLILSLLFVPLLGFVRSVPAWWLPGWIVLTGVFLLFGLAAPLIMRVNNKLTRLQDEELEAGILGLGASMDVPVGEVRVADLSRRTRRENASVGGYGKTRRVILGDTILKRPATQIRGVIAHELAHVKRHHVLTGTVLRCALMLGELYLLDRLIKWDLLQRLFRIEGLRDPGVIIVLVLVFQLVSTLGDTVSASWGRVFERQADLLSVEATGDPGPYLEILRTAHADNLLNVAPSWWERLRMDHPPAAERLTYVRDWAVARGIDVSRALDVTPS